MTTTSYFNITLNVSIVTNLTFSRVLKIFSVFFNHLKMFLHHITTVFTFFNDSANKLVNSIFIKVRFKRLTNLSSTHTNF